MMIKGSRSMKTDEIVKVFLKTKKHSCFMEYFFGMSKKLQILQLFVVYW